MEIRNCFRYMEWEIFKLCTKTAELKSLHDHLQLIPLEEILGNEIREEDCLVRSTGPGVCQGHVCCRWMALVDGQYMVC
jgi:hypothetical protein